MPTAQLITSREWLKFWLWQLPDTLNLTHFEPMSKVEVQTRGVWIWIHRNGRYFWMSRTCLPCYWIDYWQWWVHSGLFWSYIICQTKDQGLLEGRCLKAFCVLSVYFLHGCLMVKSDELLYTARYSYFFLICILLSLFWHNYFKNHLEEYCCHLPMCKTNNY